MAWINRLQNQKYFLPFSFLSPRLFSLYIWLHPPATFDSIQCFPGHLCTLIWESKVGGENNSTWKWAGDCLPPRVVMEGLSDRAPQAPPWWLISCGALELRSDTLAHQTPLSLSGTPLIARCFIIVPHSASVSGVLPSNLRVREYAMQCSTFPVAFQNVECFHMKGMCLRNVIHHSTYLTYWQVTTR